MIFYSSVGMPTATFSKEIGMPTSINLREIGDANLHHLTRDSDAHPTISKEMGMPTPIHLQEIAVLTSTFLKRAAVCGYIIAYPILYYAMVCYTISL